MVARRLWTRYGWDLARTGFELATSLAVLEELGRGNYPSRREALALVKDLPLLPFEPAVADIVDVYILQRVMRRDPHTCPSDPSRDFETSLPAPRRRDRIQGR